MPASTTTGTLGLVTRLSRLVYLRVDPESLDVPIKTLMLLNSIARAGGTISQGLLGQAMHCHPNQLVLMLNEAEAAGFAERRRDPDDRRRHIVVLTDAGRAAIADGEKVFDSLEDELLAGMSPAKRRQLGELLAEALAANDDL